MAVGSTLAYVTPHLNGAIDIMAVRQPDGTIKTSPFYGAS
jgi:phosphatidate phosphatase PAH1